MYHVCRKLMAHMVPQTQIWFHHLQYLQVHHQNIMTALSVLATTLILYRPLLWTELLAWKLGIWVLCFWDWDLKNTWVSFILIHLVHIQTYRTLYWKLKPLHLIMLMHRDKLLHSERKILVLHQQGFQTLSSDCMSRPVMWNVFPKFTL